jgi:hypothetical protein
VGDVGVWRVIGLVSALAAAGPSVAGAQSPPAKPAMASAITVSFGAGLRVDDSLPYPDPPLAGLATSVQVPFSSRWFVEGHFETSTTQRSTTSFGPARFPLYVLTDSRSVTTRRLSGGGRILYRFMAGPRVSAFAGGGLSAGRASTSHHNRWVCVPVVPGGCDARDQEPGNYETTHDSWTADVTAGIDVSVTKFVTLFGAVRIDDGVTPYGGVRFSLTTRPASRLTAPDVRLISTNGSDLRGRLISLTATEVVIKQRDRSVVIPIAEVQRVTKTTHRLRNAMVTGAILGYVSGYLLCPGPGCRTGLGLLGAGYGTGTGAVLGWWANHRAARDGRDVLYTGPSRSSATFMISPVASPRHAGIGMSVRW